MRIYILFGGQKNVYNQVLSEKVIDIFSCRGYAVAQKCKLEKQNPLRDYWIVEWKVR